MERILVTGGSGFIGTSLVQSCLDDGVEVLNLDISPPLDPRHGPFWQKTDVVDRPKLTKAMVEFRPDQVVHLAACADPGKGVDPGAYQVNVQGTLAVLESIRRCRAVSRLIVASSLLVCRIGYSPKSQVEVCPNTPYGRSKASAERLVRESSPGCDWIIVRPVETWGPWDVRSIPMLTTLKERRILHVGRIRQRRTYGYVGNTVYQIRKLQAAPAREVGGRTFYLGDGHVKTFKWINALSRRISGRAVKAWPRLAFEVAAHIGDLLASAGIRKDRLTTTKLSSWTRDNVVDLDPIRRVAGPLPISMEEGIEATASWFGRYVRSPA
jgi:nucleoside-diphosphate-sugar epimerase